MRYVAMLLALLSGAAAAGDAEQEVRCREIGFSQAAEHRDIEQFRSFIDPDARFIGRSVQRGIDAVADAWSGFFAADGPAIMWRPRFVEVLEDGNLALSRGPYRLRLTDADGNAVERWGTFNSVWRRQGNGEWKVVFDAGNEAAEAPDEATQALILDAAVCENSVLAVGEQQ